MLKTLTALITLTSLTALANPLASTVKFSNCSGFVFTMEGRSQSQNALVMTNGHCLDPLGLSMLKPDEVRINRSANRNIKLIGPKKSVKVTTKRLIYATMTLTDMAIYELSQSYEYLESKYQITPFMLSKTGPVASTVINIPSAYRKRVYNCSVEEVLFGLREGGRSFEGSLRYDRGCRTINGTSGSPLVLGDGVTVVGINNTVNNSGKMCGNNNPCEVDEAGNTTVIKKRGYGQQTALLYQCLNKDMNIDLNVEGCALPK